MSHDATAALVGKADPDRFRAVMAAPNSARPTLFAIYAFNIEVARAPWAATEPLLAEMRLQWWLDTLNEIASGGPVRRHEVATPLSKVIDGEVAGILAEVIEARRWDVGTSAHVTVKDLQEYINRTAGSLMWAAARALGAPADDDTESIVRDTARAVGLVRYFAAVPTLEARGRRPLPPHTNVALLAETAIDDLPEPKLRRSLPMPSRAVLFDAIGAEQALDAVVRSPERVAKGRVALPSMTRRVGLLARSVGF